MLRVLRGRFSHVSKILIDNKPIHENFFKFDIQSERSNVFQFFALGRLLSRKGYIGVKHSQKLEYPVRLVLHCKLSSLLSPLSMDILKRRELWHSTLIVTLRTYICLNYSLCKKLLLLKRNIWYFTSILLQHILFLLHSLEHCCVLTLVLIPLVILQIIKCLIDSWLVFRELFQACLVELSYITWPIHEHLVFLIYLFLTIIEILIIAESIHEQINLICILISCLLPFIFLLLLMSIQDAFVICQVLLQYFCLVLHWEFWAIFFVFLRGITEAKLCLRGGIHSWSSHHCVHSWWSLALYNSKEPIEEHICVFSSFYLNFRLLMSTTNEEWIIIINEIYY